MRFYEQRESRKRVANRKEVAGVFQDKIYFETILLIHSKANEAADFYTK